MPGITVLDLDLRPPWPSHAWRRGQELMLVSNATLIDQDVEDPA